MVLIFCDDWNIAAFMWVNIIIFLMFMFIIGNALVLLRTAKKPKVPKDVKPQPYEDDEDSGW